MARLEDLGLSALHGAIARGEGRVLGRGYQATVELYSTPAGDAVVKTAHGSGPLGPLYRHLLRREHGGIPMILKQSERVSGRRAEIYTANDEFKLKVYGA